jgi:hypothetical protein
LPLVDKIVFRIVKNNGIIKSALGLLIILPLLLILFNNTVYRHHHILPDGILIEHAHPFKYCCCESTDKGSKHSHSDRELLIYAVTTDSPVIASSIIHLPEVFILRESDLSVLRPDTDFVTEPVSLSLLRAPPC